MFYSLQQVVEKLGKTEGEIKDLVKQGRLREFRDGPNLLFKIDEVESLLSDTKIMASAKGASGPAKEETIEEEISLVPDEVPAGGELADADTAVAGEGINILDDMAEEYKLADDTKGETKAVSEEASLEEIEGDVNLDSFGSGSGLLDLSLQADDTSLGGILDEIYTSEGEEGKKAAEVPGADAAVEVAAEAEQMLSTEEGFAAPQPAVETVAVAYAEPEPDTASNALGMLLFLPFLLVIYTAAVAVMGFSYTLPSILKQLQGVTLYILAALFVAALIYGVAFMFVGSGTKTEKKPKVKKAKKLKAAEEEQAPPSAPASEGETA